MLLLYSKRGRKIKKLLIIITYKCGFSNKYFMKNKKKQIKSNIKYVENHINTKNMEKSISK